MEIRSHTQTQGGAGCEGVRYCIQGSERDDDYEQQIHKYVTTFQVRPEVFGLNSTHGVEHALEELHRNIACIRHPDHSGGEIVM